uniref:Uncharacterized protein n=1 Tax=Avena sativa TaxID=4498 RepID=A0ACD5XEC4_AVESA
MKIRMCANLLLGAAVPAAPPRQFELPAPSPGVELPPAARFELPPPAQESHAGSASKTSSSMPGPCVTNFFPRDLMDQLDLSDPQEEERFMETYSVPVARQPSMAAGFIKEDEEEKEKVTVDMVHEVVKDAEKEEDMAVAKVNASNLEPCVPKEVGRKTATKKEDSKPKRNKGKENAEGSNATGGEMYTCKKNDGKKWSCLRPVSQPDTLCSYHSEPRRKRVVALGNGADDEFYYYEGYGQSRYSRRHRGSSSRSVPEPAPAVEKEVAQLPEEHGDNKTRCDDKDMDGIAGYVQDTSSDDDDVKKAESSVKKRKKKPVNTRSINSLMLE